MFSTSRGSALRMANGWKAYGGAWGAPTVVKAGTLCMVSGLLRGSRWGHVMATLPSDCRPKGRLIFNMNNHAKHARVDVMTNGQIRWVTGGRDHTWISITGINIHRTKRVRRTDQIMPRRKAVQGSGVRRLGLQSGWAAYGSGYEAPSTSKHGDVCVVSGLIKRRGMRNPLATLPADCRPNKRVIFSLNNHQYQVRVDVLRNGQIHYVSGTWRHGWLNLNGIGFATRNQRKLPVQNGWRGYGGSYKVPTYTRTGAVCEVEGLVRGSRWG